MSRERAIARTLRCFRGEREFVQPLKLQRSGGDGNAGKASRRSGEGRNPATGGRELSPGGRICFPRRGMVREDSVKIFSQVGKKLSGVVAEKMPDAEVLLIPDKGPIPEGLEGEVLLTQTWGSENIAEVVARGVRWVHTLGTGVDRFPFDAVGDRPVTCSRGASSIPISEYVLAMMLAFEKRIPDLWIDEAPQGWYGQRLGGLYGRTLGLVGLGGIGVAVAQRALAFGMTVVATRRSDAPAPLSGVELTNLSQVLGRADHLVLAASATDETAGMINASTLAAAKPGLHLINVARGSLVDQDALRAALDDGTVARASLDTVSPEPLPEGHWLYEHPKVRLTPHVSWSMPGAIDLLLEPFFDNLERYRSDEPLQNVVDPGTGY